MMRDIAHCVRGCFGGNILFFGWDSDVLVVLAVGYRAVGGVRSTTSGPGVVRPRDAEDVYPRAGCDPAAVRRRCETRFV